MKNIYTLGLFCFLLFGNSHFLLAQLVGDTWAKTQQQKSGTVIITYIKTPALVYKDANDNLDGVCIDIFKAFVDYVKKNKGIIIKAKIQPEVTDFGRFLSGVSSGQGGVFGLGNITITAERKKIFQFTEPFINNLSFLITHNSLPTLNVLSSISTHFKGMKAYTVKGTTNEQYILEIKAKYFPTLQIEYVPTSGAVMTKVAGDNRSFSCLDFNYFSEGIRLQSPIKRHPIGDNGSEKFGFIMPLKSDWKGIWDEFFVQNKFVKSIEYRKILIKHLGTSAVAALDRFKD